MALSFVVTARFLDPRFHGRGDGGEPEWPPSPLRLFQTLVAASAARSRGQSRPAEVRAALVWLEEISASARIIAPEVHAPGPGYRLSVPNNAMDIVGKAWSRGNDSMVGDANPATHRAMKTIRATRFREGNAVHFIFPLRDPPTAEELAHVEALSGVARHVVALGWGIDLVVGSAAVLAEPAVEALAGERWLPGPHGPAALRIPIAGTLDALDARYRGFLERIHDRVWTTPPLLTCFRVTSYRRPHDVAARAVAAFTLGRPVEPDRLRAFDAVREGIVVAGRLRHAAYQAALASKAGQWPEAEVAAFVLGHGEASGAGHAPVGPRRFAYLPLPTIHPMPGGAERVGATHRVLVTTFADDCDREVAWVESALSGSELIDERTQTPVALLQRLEGADRVVRHYLPPRGASSWATVTPVVLPGYDDPNHYRRRLKKGVSSEEQHRLLARLDERVEGLVRKAIVQAGFSEALAASASVDFRQTGFWPGVDLAGRYRVPSHLERLPRVHVRIDWRDQRGRPLDVPGPVCIGGGRFYGLGLFAVLPQG